jgi:hypothetical protein
MPTKLMNDSDVQYKMDNAICQSVGENMIANENKIADNHCSYLLRSTPTGRGELQRDRMGV